MLTPADCYNLGVLTKPHGIQGELVLFVDADNPAAYRNLDSFYVEREGRLVPYFVEAIRPHGKRFVVKLEGVGSEDLARSLAGLKVHLPLEVLPTLGSDAFYFHEVIGWSCLDASDGEELGQVETVRDDGPYPLLIVRHATGAEIVLPLPEHIKVEVDRQANTLKVEVPEGLLDLYFGDASTAEDDGTPAPEDWDGE